MLERIESSYKQNVDKAEQEKFKELEFVSKLTEKRILFRRIIYKI